MTSIGVIGVGKLGLCMALGLEQAGYSVICNDVNTDYLKTIENKTLKSIEPGVTEALEAASKLYTVNSIKDMYKLETNFIVVATPSLPDGSYNHSAVDQIIDQLIKCNQEDPDYNQKLLVISCTTMPTYCDTVQERLAPYNYNVCYNPEFIAQGDILRGQTNPDMVLIGHSNQIACDNLVAIYKNITKNNPPFHCMTRTEAEITKISLNCFLTTKIAFANLIGDIVIKAGGNPACVLSAIGQDTRVGSKFLRWGYGFGGPCLPRDNRALCHFSAGIGIQNEIGEIVDKNNKLHLNNIVSNIKNMNTDNKPILFDSIAYKKDTNILEESQKLALAELLAEMGYAVFVHDINDNLQKLKQKNYKFTICETMPANYETDYFNINCVLF
jgi:nucleotide sugar dehydrogenase